MKKNYMKPDIIFEDFSMSTSIAAGCEAIVKNQSRGTCGYKPIASRPAYFVESLVDVCGIPIADGNNEYNNLCYHNPYELHNVFNS